MPDRQPVVFRYDGSFDGFLCCVFEGFSRRQTPEDIVCAGDPQVTLYPTVEVATDPERACRVYESLSRRISPQAEELVKQCFLRDMPGRELLIYNFLRKGFHYGGRVTSMLTDDTVNALLKAVKFVGDESHLFKGFLRFSEYDGNLVAIISPKNYVLPNLAAHFCGRFPEERFLIYDETHGMALVYQPHEAHIIPVDRLELPPEEAVEFRCRKLWKQYYNTIGIEARYNPKCCMAHMPKRYWKYLTEFLPDSPPRVAGEKNGASLPRAGQTDGLAQKEVPSNHAFIE